MDAEQAPVDLRQVYGEASDLVQRKALKALVA